MSPTPRSIRRRLMSMLLTTCGLVVLLTSVIFYVYERTTFRRTTIEHLSSIARLIAATSTPSLAFRDQADATEVLDALRLEPDFRRAALYDTQGSLFAAFPADQPREDFPAQPGPAEVRFSATHLEVFHPVVQGDVALGTLYLRMNLDSLHRRFALYGSVMTVVILASLLIAYGGSRLLQRQIADPMLRLAETARAVSERRDYTVRAPAHAHAHDEIGQLTAAFNHMLRQIQDRDEALQEGAARMEAVLDAALSAVIVVDADDRVIDWTARATAVFGWTAAEAKGRPLATLVVPPSRQEHYRRLRTRLLTTSRRRAWRAIETTALRRDGREFPVEVSISRLKTGAHLTLCGFVTDITSRKRADTEIKALHQGLERRVAERTAQLESANRELEAFSYSVSHDLRAPLRHIDGFTTMLQRHAGAQLDAQGQRYLQTVSEAARSMGRLIDDLLAFSRTGRTALKLVPVDQDALVADIITEGPFDQQDRPVDWQVERLPQVWADPGLLRQVWRNLISNAAKYSSKTAQPRIEIGADDSGAPGEHAFFVRDNGVGFDMSYGHKLFGVFQRLHRNADYPGTGIGLAHVKRIVSRHGGRVWAEGRPGAGATFWFSLPTTPNPPSDN